MKPEVRTGPLQAEISVNNSRQGKRGGLVACKDLWGNGRLYPMGQKCLSVQSKARSSQGFPLLRSWLDLSTDVVLKNQT